MRKTRTLSGVWQFQIDPEGSVSIGALVPDRQIPVPLPWQAAFPALRPYSGYAWYRREVDLDASWLDGELLLHFGAVDYWCQVFVNGALAGEHEGGYTPFTLPIRALAQAGRNEIAVRVYDAAQTGTANARWPAFPAATPPGPPFDPNQIPHGKQEWYIDVGGIWQDVTLSAVPAGYLTLVHVRPDIHSGAAHVTVEVAGAAGAPADGALQVAIAGPDGPAAAATLALAPGRQVYETTVRVEAPRLWQIEDPALYTAAVTLRTPAGDDTLTARFGFREIATRDGRLLLNGAPLFLLCALDQDLYPDTIYTVPSEEYLRDQFQKARALGLNSLRCHIKPPDPRYLDLADEMGLLIWAEIPSWRTFYPKGTIHPNETALDDLIKARVERTLEEMIRRDFNHPALICWTIVNEDWGTALPLSAPDRAWVKAMYARCKALDPTRLVVDNSACPAPWGPNIHVQSDLDDFHVYANIPDHLPGFAQTVEQLAMRPLWTYSSHGDARRSGQEPLILSEFGNWGLPALAALRRAAGGQDPAWFDIGPWWSPWDGEPGWPAGAAERFARLGLDTIWPDYDAFAMATQWHQFAALKAQIEALRCQPALAGYVITEFTDAYWESNGLLDFYRQPKAYHGCFGAVNAPDVIIPQVERHAEWDDRELRVTFYGAHYSAAGWAGARIHCSLDGIACAESVPVAALRRGAVQGLGTMRFPLPQVERARPVRFEFRLCTPDGATLARNSLEVHVLPAAARAPRYGERLAVILGETPVPLPALGAADPMSGGVTGESTGPTPPDTYLAEPIPELTPEEAIGLQGQIQALGYRTTRRLGAGIRLAVSDYPSRALLEWVRRGGDLLFLTRGPSPFFWVQPRGGAYSGSWMTSFSWLRPLPGGRVAAANPLSLPFLRLMPHMTILGLPVEDPAVQPDLLAGMVSGWVGHPSVHAVQFRYGRGRVIMTTLAFWQALPDDPTAVALFHDLIEYLASDACRPHLTANF